MKDVIRSFRSSRVALVEGLLGAILVAGCATGAEKLAAPSEQPPTTQQPGTPDLVFASVSAGAVHTCGVTTSGAAYCWGDNGRGQLGNGTYTNSTTPVPVAGGLTFAAVSAGYLHTCGVTKSGAAYCWGEGGMGQLGAAWPLAPGCDALDGCPSPVAVAGGLSFAEVSAGTWHSCGVTTAGAAYCWGGGSEGVLGCDSLCSSGGMAPEPVAGGLTFSTVSAGEQGTCGVTVSGAAYCWGSNFAGQLGTGTTTGPEQCIEYGEPPDTMTYVHGCSHKPVAVAGGRTFTDISTAYGSCGLAAGGAVYCWGRYILGDGTDTAAATPVTIAGGLSFSAVSAGEGTACAVTTSGAGYCWGYNSVGQVGDGTTTNRLTPVLVAGGLTFVAISPRGWLHTCGVTTGGVAYCWGQGGRLGNGTTTGSSVPVKVAGQAG